MFDSFNELYKICQNILSILLTNYQRFNEIKKSLYTSPGFLIWVDTYLIWKIY